MMSHLRPDERSDPPAARLDAFHLSTAQDLTRLRYSVLHHSRALGFSPFDRTRIATAASELGRNILTYASTGTALLEQLGEPPRGLRLVFADQGPGISNLEQALEDGFSTGRGLGLGLGGTRRLVDHFDVQTGPSGTQITIIKWRPEP